MTELEQLRKVAHEAARYLNGDGSRAELAKALQVPTPQRWTHVGLTRGGLLGRVQGEEGSNVRIVDANGGEHLVPKASLHLSWAPV
ncbi:hypothetical protein D3C77_365960 [compost metagenome]